MSGRKADRLKTPPVDGPVGLVVRTPSTQTAEANAEVVASLVGAGRGTREIARTTGQTARNVRLIKEKLRTDPQLKKVHDEARARIRSKALDILESKMDVVERSWNDTAELKDQAQMVKALGDVAFPRWGEVGGPSGPVGPQVNINLGDPAVLVAMTEALRRLNTPVLDVTPRRENDE